MIDNGRIASTNLGMYHTGHGIMSFNLTIEGDGWGQSFGGLTLDGPVHDMAGKFLYRRGSEIGMEIIRQITEVFECDWEDLPGKYCRIQRDTEFGKIVAVGHITKDRWYNTNDSIACARRYASGGE